MRTLALAAILMGCQQASAIEAPPQEDPPEQRFERDMVVRFHMHENFGMLRSIEKLLVHGKLEEARKLAQGIAEAPDEPGLGEWARYQTMVRDRAAVLARARSIEEACTAEARMAVACARCHAQAGVVPDFRPPASRPVDDSSVQSRMASHVWATDRLWEGIVGGDDESWIAGLDILAAPPLKDPGFSPERATAARRLQQLATSARQHYRSETAEQRARTYGALLATCSACHLQPPPR